MGIHLTVRQVSISRSVILILHRLRAIAAWAKIGYCIETAMITSATKLSYHDYLLLPDDGKRYEILNGDLYMTPSPVTRHQLIAFRLSHVFMAYLEGHPIGTGLAAV